MGKARKVAGNLIGVISDTHNLLRPEAIKALTAVDLIIHAGDVCQPQILKELETIAPVIAVRGNHDKEIWAENIPISEMVTVSRSLIYIIHDIKQIEIDPTAAGVGLVISGHSHNPSLTERSGVLYLNPGSAGQRRFKLPISVARLKIDGKTITTEIVQLHV